MTGRPSSMDDPPTSATEGPRRPPVADEPDRPGLRVAAARGVLWTSLRTWGSRLATLLVIAILARHLDAHAFGVMALAVAVMEIIRVVLTEGLTRAIVQRPDLDQDHLDSAFWISAGAGALLCLLGVLSAEPLARLFNEPDFAAVFRALSVSFVLTALSTTQMGILQRNLEFRKLAVRDLTATLLGGAAGIVLAVGGAGVWALVTQHLVQAAVALVVLWTVSPYRPGRQVSWPRLREILTYGMTTQAIHLVSQAGQRSELVFIGTLLGASTLGFYSMAHRVLQLTMQLFGQTISIVAFPVFSRMQHDPERIRNALHTASRASSVIAFPTLLLLSAMAPQVIYVMFGASWGMSGRLLQIMALVGLVNIVTYFSRALMLGIGRAGGELGWVVFFTSTKIVALFAGLPWGVEGVAWAVVAHGYLAFPLRIVLLNRVLPIDPAAYVATFLRPLAASVVMLGAVIIVRAAVAGTSGPALITVCTLAGGTVYLGTLMVIAPATLRELLAHAMSVRRTSGKESS